jgi:hypothetical protein
VIDTVVDEDPFGEVSGVGRIEIEFDEVEAGLLDIGVVAFGAVFLDEFANGRRERGGVGDARGEKQKAKMAG